MAVIFQKPQQRHSNGTSHHPWDLKQLLLHEIKHCGGFINTHSHIDRAFTITPISLSLSYSHLSEKWALVDEVKRHSSVDDIYDRMMTVSELMLTQGVKIIGSFIDVDPIIGDKSIKAAIRTRQRYQGDVEFVFMNQCLKGVLNEEAQKWFIEGAQFADILGGLPAKDAGHEEDHLDFILGTAKQMNKMVHVHVDQLNSPEEYETELLIQKTVEHGMQGNVVAIHGVSIAAHPLAYRAALYTQMKKAEIMVISCPTAWIDARRNETLTPTHNAIAPIEELTAAGIPVAIGTDNIADIYKPFTDGDMWTELRMLIETCHFYELSQLVKIATQNGRKVLGLT